MATIYYLPDNREVETETGETILRTSLGADIPHTHVCGGKARCSTCRVMILEGLENCGPRNEKEQAMAHRLHFPPDIRLACQTQVFGKVKLRRLVLDAEDRELYDQQKEQKMTGMVGEEKQIAILFSDIRGFTPFSESVPAYDVIHVLNRYYHHMGRVITRNGGEIDNYLGDGILALFGVRDPANAAFMAVKTGLEMLQEMEIFNRYLEPLYKRGLEIGIGIHFGEAVVGEIGATGYKKMTAIGDSVNFASRIESANKEAGTHLLISEDTFEVVRESFQFGKVSCLPLKGKSGSYNLYEVVG